MTRKRKPINYIKYKPGSLWLSGFLNLNDWILKGIAETEDGVYLAAAEYIGGAILEQCSNCQSKDFTKWGAVQQEIADIPHDNKPVVILLKRQRFRCKECGKSWVQEIRHLDSRRAMTNRLRRYIQSQSLIEPFTRIAARVGLDEKTVRNVFADYVEKLDAKYSDKVLPTWLGMDEVYIVRKYRFIMTNIQSRQPYELLERRTKPYLEHYFARLPRAELEAVELVAMDMWNPYRDMVGIFMPNAQIVVDKFHVLKHANEALERVRKRTRKAHASQRRQLKRDRFILLRRRHELDERDELILRSWINTFEDLGHAYQYKEALYNIWEYDDREAVEVMYEEWVRQLPDSIREDYSDLTRAISNWHDEVFAYFDTPITNAFTESMNSVMKQVNRDGRGYSFDVIRAKLLYRWEQSTNNGGGF